MAACPVVIHTPNFAPVNLSQCWGIEYANICPIPLY
jgi:hypothetical protein